MSFRLGSSSGWGTGFGRAKFDALPAGTLQPVYLLGVPLRLLKASEDHFDDLFRELQLANLAQRGTLGTVSGPPDVGLAGATRPPPAGCQVQRLAALSEEVKSYLAEFREPARRAIREAAQSGARLVDIDVVVDSAVLGAFRRCEHFLLGAARAARAGYLLTEPPGREVEAWRKWVTRELADQMEGKAPRPCPFPPCKGRSFVE